jgi:hypothetical protein
MAVFTEAKPSGTGQTPGRWRPSASPKMPGTREVVAMCAPHHQVSGDEPAACHFSSGELAFFEEGIDRMRRDAKHLGRCLDVKDVGISCGQ